MEKWVKLSRELTPAETAYPYKAVVLVKKNCFTPAAIASLAIIRVPSTLMR